MIEGLPLHLHALCWHSWDVDPGVLTLRQSSKRWARGSRFNKIAFLYWNKGRMLSWPDTDLSVCLGEAGLYLYPGAEDGP